MKKVAVIQSNYIPWKGYFDMIHDVDLFVFHDDLQYTNRDWRNRNKIKTPEGEKWLSIPVGNKDHQLICDVALEDHSWQRKHWAAITQYYHDAPHFKDYYDFFNDFFITKTWNNLSEMNQHMIKSVSSMLSIKTEFIDSRSLNLTGKKTDRLIDLLTKTGAGYYLSGPAAKDYLEEEKFKAANIELAYKDYSGYPEYPQMYGGFTHQVSIVDLLFNCGDKSPYYIWSWRNDR